MIPPFVIVGTSPHAIKKVRQLILIIERHYAPLRINYMFKVEKKNVYLVTSVFSLIFNIVSTNLKITS